MKRWLAPLIGLAALALPLLAGATAYNLPNNMPAGCTRTGSNYTCPGGGFGYGDTLTVSAPKPATVTIAGNFSTDTSQINQGGSASDLTVIINGTLTLGYQAKITANVTATSVNDAGGGNVTITGDLTASGGNISLAYQSSVTGNVSTTGTGTITTGQNATVGGNVSAGTGTITVSEQGTVSGSITSSGGTVTVVQSATVVGNVSAGSGAVNLGYQSKVNGNISTTGAISLSQGSRTGGTITGGAGNVTVGYQATVVGALTTSSGTISFDQGAVASACVKSTSSASITLGTQSSINSVCCGASCSTSCVTNNSGYAMPAACAGATPAIASFAISGTGSASTCSPQVLTITARDSSGNTLTGYTGTIKLSTSTGNGVWSAGTGPAPSGTFTAGASNSGLATYAFSTLDAGVVKLRLANSLAQNVTVNVVDSTASGTSTNSAAINFRDNAFLWAEDLSNKIAGTFVAVAGRTHDMQVSLIKKDPTTGSCGVAIDYAGNRNLKLWRTDNGGPWTAPSVVTSAIGNTAVPTSRPSTNNLTLSFTAGVARFNLATTDIGKYAFSVDDDSLSYAATTVSGSSLDLTVRPFTIAVSSLALGGTANPGNSTDTGGVFGKAGAAFSATVTAYRWSSSADSTNTGTPDASATLSQVSSGGAAPSYSTSVSLTPLAASQTPSTGVLGTLSNGTVSSFSNGAATVATLAYSEVGSFTLNTTAVTANFLSTASLKLDAVVFDASGNQQTRVGRFIPAGFDVSSFVVVHRSSRSCSPASTFSYMGEGMTYSFTLTAKNTAGTVTQNYAGSFAKLPTDATTMNVAGIAGTTMFKPGTGERMGTAFGSGTWTKGVANISLTANALRGTSPDGPFPNAQFGIAPMDSDGVGMLTLNLDTDYPANGADRALLGQVPLRYGRLRLQNGMSAANRVLRLPMTAQYWDSGTGTFKTNDLDFCTSITSANLSFGNLRKGLTTADAVMSPSSVTVDPTKPVFITLAAPGGGRVGSMDIAITMADDLTDQSCLKRKDNWTPTVPATAGANIRAMRSTWCGSAFASDDPSARATWGAYRGSDGVIYQRENY